MFGRRMAECPLCPPRPYHIIDVLSSEIGPQRRWETLCATARAGQRMNATRTSNVRGWAGAAQMSPALPSPANSFPANLSLSTTHSISTNGPNGQQSYRLILPAFDKMMRALAATGMTYPFTMPASPAPVLHSPVRAAGTAVFDRKSQVTVN